MKSITSFLSVLFCLVSIATAVSDNAQGNANGKDSSSGNGQTTFSTTDLVVIELSGPTYDEASSILYGLRALEKLTQVFEKYFPGEPIYVNPGQSIYLSDDPAVDYANEQPEDSRRKLGISTCPKSCRTTWTSTCDKKCSGSGGRRRSLRGQQQRSLSQFTFDMEKCLAAMNTALVPYENKYQVELEVLIYTV